MVVVVVLDEHGVVKRLFGPFPSEDLAWQWAWDNTPGKVVVLELELPS